MTPHHQVSSLVWHGHLWVSAPLGWQFMSTTLHCHFALFMWSLVFMFLTVCLVDDIDRCFLFGYYFHISLPFVLCPYILYHAYCLLLTDVSFFGFYFNISLPFVLCPYILYHAYCLLLTDIFFCGYNFFISLPFVLCPYILYHAYYLLLLIEFCHHSFPDCLQLLILDFPHEFLILFTLSRCVFVISMLVPVSRLTSTDRRT